MRSDNLTPLEALIWAAAYAQRLPSLDGFDSTARTYALDAAEQHADGVIEARRDRAAHRAIEATAPKETDDA